MSGRAAASWQTSLADLSLILFMVTAAAVSEPVARNARPNEIAAREAAKRQAVAAPSPVAEPLSVFISAPEGPKLASWLAQQAPDPRQQLTITALYDATQGTSREAALSEALALAREAGRAGLGARIVVEPGRGPSRAVLAFDAPSAPR